MKITPDKYRREILRRLPKGYRIDYLTHDAVDDNNQRRRVTGSHRVLFDPDGEIVRGSDGRPVRVCSTPGSDRALTADLATIRRAGVKIT